MHACCWSDNYRGNIIDVDFQKLSFPVGNLLLQVQPWLAISLMYLDQIRIVVCCASSSHVMSHTSWVAYLASPVSGSIYSLRKSRACSADIRQLV